jgi:hypothetical protein
MITSELLAVEWSSIWLPVITDFDGSPVASYCKPSHWEEKSFTVVSGQRPGLQTTVRTSEPTMGSKIASNEIFPSGAPGGCHRPIPGLRLHNPKVGGSNPSPATNVAKLRPGQ